MVDGAVVTHGAARRRALPFPLIVTAGIVVLVLAIAAGAFFALKVTDSSSASLEAAQASYENGDFAAAEQASSSIIAKDAADSEARLLLARSLAAQGKNDEAIEQYSAIVDADPKNHESLYAMASIEQLIGKTPEAIGHLERAVELDANVDYLAALAPLYATVGRWDDAVHMWEQYLDAAEIDAVAQASVYASIADAYENARAYDEAKAALGEALFLDPNNEAYKARLEAYGS